MFTQADFHRHFGQQVIMVSWRMLRFRLLLLFTFCNKLCSFSSIVYFYRFKGVGFLQPRPQDPYGISIWRAVRWMRLDGVSYVFPWDYLSTLFEADFLILFA